MSLASLRRAVGSELARRLAHPAESGLTSSLPPQVRREVQVLARRLRSAT